jgi:hypothetical protein
MTHAILKQDGDSLTKYQIENFHNWEVPKPPKGAEDDKYLPIASQNQYVHDHCSWNTIIHAGLTCRGTGISRDYIVDKNMHKLLKVKVVQPLPTLIVREEHQETVQIAWSYNCAPNAVDSATMYVDTTEVGRVDSKSIAMDYMNFRDPSNPDPNSDFGNIPILIDFSHHLPEHTVSADLPFGFSRYINTAFPLHRTNMCETKFSVNIKREIYTLLRMRKRDNKDAPWVNLEDVDTATLLKYLLGVGNGFLPEPEFIGTYGCMSERELKDVSCDDETKMWYTDWHTVDYNNSFDYGQIKDIPIECEFPVLGVFVQMENQLAMRFHNLGNGTTDADNVYKGYHSVAQVKFRQGNVHRLQGVSSHYLRGGLKDESSKEGYSPALLHKLNEPCFTSSPDVHGYVSIPFCRMKDLRDNRSTQIFKDKNKAMLSIRLGNCNPYLKPPAGEKRKDLTFVEDANNKFSINVRLLVLREIKFGFEGKTQKVYYT